MLCHLGRKQLHLAGFGKNQHFKKLGGAGSNLLDSTVWVTVHKKGSGVKKERKITQSGSPERTGVQVGVRP